MHTTKEVFLLMIVVRTKIDVSVYICKGNLYYYSFAY